MTQLIVWTAFLLGLALGVLVGIKWRPPIRNEVTLTVDKAVSHQITFQMVCQWLDLHGLTWMPKGKEFKYPAHPDGKRDCP